MSVLIVARTNMSESKRCIGGLLNTRKGYGNFLRSVRIRPDGGGQFKEDAPFEVGEYWDIDFSYWNNAEPPHTEDVFARNWDHEGECDDITTFLRKHEGRLRSWGRWWEGSGDTLFNGKIQSTGSGTGYVSREDIPDMSTGFWTPDEDLKQNRYGKYRYSGQSSVSQLSCVSETDLPEVIPAGTLCRVSLARWWDGQEGVDEERCYLQLSGAYLDSSNSTFEDGGRDSGFDPVDELPF